MLCIHKKKKRDIVNVDHMSLKELRELRDEIDRRLADPKQSVVLERRYYSNGVLQLEKRVYPKTGREQGPYWYFKYREAGKQRTLYLGKTHDPEVKLEQVRRKELLSKGHSYQLAYPNPDSDPVRIYPSRIDRGLPKLSERQRMLLEAVYKSDKLEPVADFFAETSLMSASDACHHLSILEEHGFFAALSLGQGV